MQSWQSLLQQKKVYSIVTFAIIFLYLCLCIPGTAAEGLDLSDATQIKDHLLLKSNRLEYSQRLVHSLNVSFVFKKGSVDKKHSVFSADGMVFMSWKDDNLAWDMDPTKIMSIYLDPSEVCHPEFSLAGDNVAPNTRTDFNSGKIRLYNGSMTWSLPSVRLNVFCVVRPDKGLKDGCAISLTFWWRRGRSFIVDIDTNEVATYVEAYDMQPWNVWSHKTRTTELIFYLEGGVETRSSGYLAPLYVFIILCLFGFWHHPRSFQPIVIGCFNTCLIALFILYISNQPSVINSENIPGILQLYCSLLYTSALSIVLAMCVFTLASKPRPYGAPLFLKSMLTGRLKNILFMSDYAVRVSPAMAYNSSCLLDTQLLAASTFSIEPGPSGTTEVELTEQADIAKDGTPTSTRPTSVCEVDVPKVDLAAEWILVAVLLQRVAFIFFSVIFFALYMRFCL